MRSQEKRTLRGGLSRLQFQSVGGRIGSGDFKAVEMQQANLQASLRDRPAFVKESMKRVLDAYSLRALELQMRRIE